MDYDLLTEQRAPWQGLRWRCVSMDGRLVAKGWIRPNGRVEHTHGAGAERWPEGLAEELAEEGAAYAAFLSDGGGMDESEAGDVLADED